MSSVIDIDDKYKQWAKVEVVLYSTKNVQSDEVQDIRIPKIQKTLIKEVTDLMYTYYVLPS